jgi:hypothetical protein
LAEARTTIEAWRDDYNYRLVALSIGAQIVTIPVFFISPVESGTGP